ncbi:MAG: dockerin type I repeat-containing protein [Planctomycetota bacterium]
MVRTSLFSKFGLVASICALCASSAIVDAQVCYETTIFTVSKDDAFLREVDLATGNVLSMTPLNLGPGQVISGVQGLDIDPITGDYYLLVKIVGTPGDIPFLCSLFPAGGGDLSIIGSTVLDFRSLSFLPSGSVQSISSETSSPALAFCELSLLTGSPIDICGVSGGDVGEAAAYRPVDGIFYRGSGTQDVIFQQLSDIMTGPGTPCGTTNIALSNDTLEGGEITALCYWPSQDKFLWKKDAIGDPLYAVSPTGAIEFVVNLDHNVGGMFVVETVIPCPAGGFRRGDVNDDGGTNIADAVFLLNSLFVPSSPSTTCLDSADSNDDGAVNIADAVYLLNALFVIGSPPTPAPGPTNCGPDPTSGDPLDCVDYSSPC